MTVGDLVSTNSYKKNTLILTLLIVIGVIFLIINNTYLYFSFDEAYSIHLVKNSYLEIIKGTSKDAHPPLYYILLKTYVIIVGDSIFALRNFSLLAIFLLLSLSLFPIRQSFGDKSAILYVLFFILLPATQYLSFEIRMYSWCALFLTITVIYAYLSYTERKFKYWVIFTLFATFSIYTHNFGLVTVGIIYFLMFIVLFFDRGQRQYLKYLSISVIVCVLLYLPWFIVLMNQVGRIVHNSWIPRITIDYILTYPYYIFENGDWGTFSLIMSALLPILSIFLIIYSFVTWTKSTILKFYSILCVITFTLISISGLFLSYILSTPIFIPRYMSLGLGILILGISILFSNIDMSKRKIKYPLLLFSILLLLHTYLKYDTLHSMNREKELNRDKVDSFIKEHIDINTIFLYNQEAYSFEDYMKLTLRYPDYKHIFYSEKFVDEDSQTIEKITKSDDIIFSQKLPNIYHFPTKSKEISLSELEKYYVIEDSIYTNESTILYYLKK